MKDDQKVIARREFLRDGLRGASLLGLGAAAGLLTTKSRGDGLVWQLDPNKCTRCGNCATYCVLKPSAV